MPEGDTVFLAATRLRAALVGQVLLATDFRLPRLATADLAGQRVVEVLPRGKHLFLRTDAGVSLHTHFRLQGAWHLYRPGRKAGALVVLVDGRLSLYVERGGRSLLTYPPPEAADEADVLGRAADALALAVRDGLLGRLAVERADGETVFDTPLAKALTAAGFRPSARGLLLRG